jgi:hypothetical protein
LLFRYDRNALFEFAKKYTQWFSVSESPRLLPSVPRIELPELETEQPAVVETPVRRRLQIVRPSKTDTTTSVTKDHAKLKSEPDFQAEADIAKAEREKQKLHRSVGNFYWSPTVGFDPKPFRPVMVVEEREMIMLYLCHYNSKLWNVSWSEIPLHIVERYVKFN